MRRSRVGSRRFALGALAPLIVSLAVPLGAQAARTVTPGQPPLVSTGRVGHVRGASAVLNGTVNPRSSATSYLFEYGPTAAYTSKTTPATLPAGIVKVKVGQAVNGLLPGYHYRIVATNEHGTTNGRDRTFGIKATKPKFVLPKESAPTVFGTEFVLNGSLAGAGNANRQVVLQSSPFPYLTPFATIGTPVLTNSVGRFLLRAPNLQMSTQFRVSTLDPRPLYSSIVTQHVAVHVTLKVRSAGRTGLVRLSGTISPALVGTRVSFQLRKPIRPNSRSEKTTRFATQFSTSAKRAGKTFSRFSAVVEVSKGGRYRAYVQVKKGALVPGESKTAVLRASPTATKKKHHHKRR